MQVASGPQPYQVANTATTVPRSAGGQPRANNLQFGILPDLGVCSIPCACAGCLVPVGIIAAALLFAKKALGGVSTLIKKLTGLAAQAAGELKKAAQQS